MNKVNTLRKKIDEIDERILDLIAKRLNIVEEIGKEKRNSGIGIVDKKREELILSDLKKSGEEKGVSSEVIEKIWKILIKAAYVIERR